MFTRQRPEATVLPREARARFREGLVARTNGWSRGFVQANLVTVPRRHAIALRRFAVRNPRACPLLGVVPAGGYRTDLAPGADLRRDLPAYHVWKKGRLVAQRTSVVDLWGDDLVTLLIGCSFTFEPLLERGGVPLRHLEQGREVPVYRTNRWCLPAGRFRGPLLVSMRPVPAELVERAALATKHLTMTHGGPVHAGDPKRIGVRDLSQPAYGHPLRFEPGDVPVFWACALTLHEAVVGARLPFAITHAPGHLLITDRRVRGTGPIPVYR